MKKELETLSELRHSLKKKLKKSRYEHTLGVEFTCAALAMRYGADIFHARIAGLMHDCAKNIDESEQLLLCEKYKLPVSEIEKRLPYLLHGKLGAYITEHEYNISNPNILSAITYHTTGKEDMTLLEKIVFTADYIEPCRDKAPRLKEIRELAFTDLDTAILMIYEDTISYVKSGSVNDAGEIDETTIRAYEYIKKKISERNL